MTGDVAALADAVERDRSVVRADLERLVRIASVSSDPSAAPHLRASADEVAGQLRAAGFEDVEVVSAPDGLPAVRAHEPAPPGQPTVLLYAHHDVQPTGRLALWQSAPFEPEERDGRLFGRGAADDKAGVALHCSAVRALRAVRPAGTGLGVGVNVLVEGEEEIGSPTLPALLDRYRESLEADVLVLADSTNWQVGVPALTTSLRGGVAFVVEVATLRGAVHSGVYGGAVPDALIVLARLLASLHDEDGNVAVRGLVRGEADPLDLTEERLRADAGLKDGVRLVGSGSLTSRLWRAPAMSVVAIDAPRVDDSSLALVPTARAKLALRVAPGDDAARAREAVIRHLEAHVPWGAELTIDAGDPVAPFSADTSGRAYDVARRAFEDAWGTPPVDVGVGGSIAFVPRFAEAFPDADVLVTGIEDPDTRAHAANESLHLGDFEKACLAEALFLARLGSA